MTRSTSYFRKFQSIFFGTMGTCNNTPDDQDQASLSSTITVANEVSMPKYVNGENVVYYCRRVRFNLHRQEYEITDSCCENDPYSNEKGDINHTNLINSRKQALWYSREDYSRFRSEAWEAIQMLQDRQACGTIMDQVYRFCCQDTAHTNKSDEDDDMYEDDNVILPPSLQQAMINLYRKNHDHRHDDIEKDMDADYGEDDTIYEDDYDQQEDDCSFESDDCSFESAFPLSSHDYHDFVYQSIGLEKYIVDEIRWDVVQRRRRIQRTSDHLQDAVLLLKTDEALEQALANMCRKLTRPNRLFAQWLAQAQAIAADEVEE